MNGWLVRWIFLFIYKSVLLSLFLDQWLLDIFPLKMFNLAVKEKLLGKNSDNEYEHKETALIIT